MKKNSLLDTTDLRNQLKIIRLSERMLRNGFSYKFTRSEWNEILLIFNGYVNLYGKVQDYESKKEI